MKKRFKIHLMRQKFYTVDVDAEDQDEAIKKAIVSIHENEDYHLISQSNQILQVLINDRYEREFSEYVAEEFPT